MKIDNRIIELVVKKMIGEAGVEELQELNILLHTNADMQEAIAILLEEWTYEEQVPGNQNHLLFEKIKAKIAYKT